MLPETTRNTFIQCQNTKGTECGHQNQQLQENRSGAEKATEIFEVSTIRAGRQVKLKPIEIDPALVKLHFQSFNKPLGPPRAYGLEGPWGRESVKVVLL